MTDNMAEVMDGTSGEENLDITPTCLTANDGMLDQMCDSYARYLNLDNEKEVTQLSRVGVVSKLTYFSCPGVLSGKTLEL